jgi:hypothetical protein
MHHFLVSSLLVVMALAGAACGGSGDEKPYDGEMFVVSSGRSLHLFGIVEGEPTELGAAELPSEGLLDGHGIFGIIRHPSEPWFYTTSFNDCREGDYWCWGNARVDRFLVESATITHLDQVFTYDSSATDSSCAQDDWGYDGQVGACAPVNGVFSVDGERLFMNDDSDDVFQIFSVDAATGGLDMLFEGESTSYHGMAVHPDLPIVYNGANVFEIDAAGEVATRTFSDFSAGNGTTIVDFDGSTLLVTTEGTATVGVYDLADPAAPAEVARRALSGNQARDIAVLVGETLRIVVVGRNRVSMLELNGGTLDEIDVIELESQPPHEHRMVHLVEGGSRALVAWFRFTYFESRGGFTVYDVGADGSLTEGATVELPYFSRAITDATLP